MFSSDSSISAAISSYRLPNEVDEICLPVCLIFSDAYRLSWCTRSARNDLVCESTSGPSCTGAPTEASRDDLEEEHWTWALADRQLSILSNTLGLTTLISPSY